MKRSDAELIDEILSGDEDAFSALVEKYEKSVHALAWRKIGDFHVAEEVTQDTFLQVYKKLPTIKNPKHFPGWLYVIANRQCITWLRKNDKHAIQSLEATSQDTLEETAYACFVSEKREETEVERRRVVVENLLEKLPESERTVVILHYLGEMSCDAIGKFLGVSPNTVKSRLRRARNRLRENESLIINTLGSVKLSPNLSESIMREIANVSQTSSTGTKPLLPLASLGSSLLLVILLIGASNQYLTHFQLPYSYDAPQETTIEIVESPFMLNNTRKLDVQNRLGREVDRGKSNNYGLQEGNTSMQNDFVQDSTKWKLPEGAKARLGKGHIFDMAYSPDGTQLAAAGTIGIWLYDTLTGEEYNLLYDNMDSVSTVAFSHDSKYLASDGIDNTIIIWDPSSGQHIDTFKGHQDYVNSVAFSPDGKTLVSGGGDETVRLWDVATGQLRLTFAGHADGVSDVVFSPDGEMLASHGNRDGNLYLWDAHTGEFLHSLTGHDGDVNCITFSPDGKTLASGGEDGTIRLWKTYTGQMMKTIEVTSGLHGIKSIVFVPNENIIINTNYGDDKIKFWDCASNELLYTINSPPETTYHMVVSPDGMTLVNAGSDGTIQFWDVATLTSIRTLHGYAEMFRDMSYSPDGNILATVSTGPSLRLWDPNSGRLKTTYYPGSVSITSIDYAPDGVTLACAPGPNEYDTVYLFNTETGEQGRVFNGDYDGFESVAISPIGNILAGGDNSGNIYLWDVFTGEIIRILKWHGDIVRTLSFSPDGKLLVGTSDSGTRFWDIVTGETFKDFASVYITLSPSWEKFVCVDWGKNGLMQFWNMGEDEPIKTITTEERTYFQTYSPDGSEIVGIGPGNNITFWDADSLKVIHSIADGHKKSAKSEGVWFVRYSPDGGSVATAGWDSTVLLWDVPQ
ncbi:MAG: sigma-70 family RNA polymerase sigma factor [Candidatus Poribacteria bacterium]|nr:sigma-70 family RNA polymerase sigma factor [Candidatus Poribacteria bacterium]